MNDHFLFFFFLKSPVFTYLIIQLISKTSFFLFHSACPLYVSLLLFTSSQNAFFWQIYYIWIPSILFHLLSSYHLLTCLNTIFSLNISMLQTISSFQLLLIKVIIMEVFKWNIIMMGHQKFTVIIYCSWFFIIKMLLVTLSLYRNKSSFTLELNFFIWNIFIVWLNNEVNLRRQE